MGLNLQYTLLEHFKLESGGGLFYFAGAQRSVAPYGFLKSPPNLLALLFALSLLITLTWPSSPIFWHSWGLSSRCVG